MRITIISGTNRANSMTMKVVEKYVEIVKSQGDEPLLLNIREVFESTAVNQVYGKMENSFEQICKDYIEGIDKFVFIIPEYNGSFPGVLKFFMDLVPPKFFRDKKAAVVGVSSGRAGNIRGLDQFIGILNHIKVSVLSMKPLLSNIESLVDSDNNLQDDFSVKLLEEQAAKIANF